MSVVDLAEARYERAADAESASPLDCLRAVASKVERGELEVSGLCICLIGSDGSVSSWAAGNVDESPLGMVGLLEAVKHQRISCVLGADG